MPVKPQSQKNKKRVAAGKKAWAARSRGKGGRKTAGKKAASGSKPRRSKRPSLAKGLIIAGVITTATGIGVTTMKPELLDGVQK
ncbi:unnamed protein product, partial [marine sediment metagenome]